MRSDVFYPYIGLSFAGLRVASNAAFCIRNASSSPRIPAASSRVTLTACCACSRSVWAWVRRSFKCWISFAWRSCWACCCCCAVLAWVCAWVSSSVKRTPLATSVCRAFSVVWSWACRAWVSALWRWRCAVFSAWACCSSALRSSARLVVSSARASVVASWRLRVAFSCRSCSSVVLAVCRS